MTSDPASGRSAQRAELLARRLRPHGAPTRPNLVIPRLRDGAQLPLSFAQQRLWFMEQLVPGNVAYTMQDARYRLRGPLRVDALARALRAVVARHDVLRSRFAVAAGEPSVVVDDPGVVRLRLRDLSGQPDPETTATRVAAEDADEPFDLERGPLLRAVLLRLGEDDHVLVVTVHHAVFDGWSVGVFERDLSAAYRAVLSGGGGLPDLVVRYADFADWQRRSLEETPPTAQLDFWRAQLADLRPALQLPEDLARPAVPTYRGGVVHRYVGEHTANRLRALALDHGATLFMVGLAAYHVLLSRYARTTDIVTGSPTAGRNRPELEELIGFFVNTVPLRTSLADNPVFSEHLANTRDVTLAAFAQDLPFEQLVEQLAPPRDTSRNPLVQVWFDLFPLGCALELDGVAVERFPVEEENTRFDLELHLMADDSGSVEFQLVYAKDMFEPAGMARFADHYRTLLDAIATDPHRRTGELVAMPAQERHELLHERNDTTAPAAAHRDLVSWFEAAADAHSDATAVVHGDTSVTFAELDRRANRIAHTLREHGAGPDVVVGLLLPRGVDQMTHLLAVLKAGSAYLPLDPEHPDARIAYMLDTANARLTVTTDDLAAKLPGTVPVLPAQYAHPDRTDRPRQPAVAGQLAYVIYTSGSTGQPKAVGMAVEPLLNLLAWQLGRATAAGPTAQFSALNFDISFQEIFSTWLAGGSVVLLEEDDRRDPHRMLATMVATGTRRLFCPPLVLEELARAAAGTDRLPPLAEIMTAGEQLHLSPDVRRMLARLPGVVVDNQYGPTEAHVITAHRMTGDISAWPGSPPVGGPIANTRVYVLDEHLNPVETGVPGDLCVGGVCLARGYLNRADLTAERFLPDPYSPVPGECLYRTGDLVRWTPSGALQVLGRIDHQVKIRGYRIEPGEIETTLINHPDITDCAVLPVEVTPGDLRLVAYVVPAPGAEPAQVGLRSFLAETLPDYMLPSHVVLLDRLPRTGPGKLDRRALPMPDRPAGGATGYVAPHNAREETIAAIWADVIGVPRVGVLDDFFDLGGHSLLATKLVARLRTALDVDLPVRAIFTARTIAGLSGMIAQAGRPARPPLRSQPHGDRPPLSFAQQRLWFVERLRPGSAAYHVTRTYRFTGRIDADVLAEALRQVAERQTALLFRFPVGEDGQPHVALCARTDLKLVVEDLSAATDRVDSVRRRAVTEGERPFDLERGPLLRAVLLRLGEDDHVLVVIVHHAVFDGWSAGVFERDLTEAYHAVLGGGSPAWAELPVQYVDFAVWQRQWITGQALDVDREYWREQLAGMPAALQLPEDLPRPTIPSLRGGTVSRTIPAATLDRLRRIASDHGATLFMVGLAAYHVLLSRYARTTDVVTGSPTAGRTHPELEGLIGFFVNVIPLRTSLADNPVFSAHLANTRDVTLAAFAHQDLPFEQLVEHLVPPRDTSRNPVVQASFQLYRNDQEPGLDLGGVRSAEFVDNLVTTRFDVELHLVAGDDGPADLLLVYAEDLFEPGSMARFADHYGALLDAIATDPHRRVDDLVAMSPAERHQVLHGHNDTDSLVDPTPLIERFRAVVSRHPTAIAVSTGTVRHSYAELDQISDRIAHTLRDRGVWPGTVAAVALPRGPDLVAHLLAVLKAGGAYLPLDPSHPPGRLAGVLAAARPVVTVATPELAGDLPGGIPVLRNDHAHVPGPPPDPGTAPDDLAYVIYTSGSTGTPKGVMVTLTGLANLVDWHLRTYRLGPDDVVSQVANPTFDAAGWEIWPALLSGARLAVPPDIVHDPDALIRHYAEEGTTVAFVPTPVGELLARRPLDAGTRLRALLVGGAAFRPRATDRPGIPVINHYGLTEATVVTTATDPLAPPWRTPPLGGPIANTRVYVLDEHLNPAEVGVPGELHVGGVSVARGYLRQPDLTAERFVPDPYSRVPGARLYRTGDLVRWTPSGGLQFLGRIDQQVKIRGYRIEPGEIEAALIARPGITEAAVVPHETETGQHLVAYVVADGPVDPAETRHDLATTLPAYLVPTAVVRLGALPKADSGKLDHSALPAPVADLDHDRVAPGNAREETLAEIWSDVLGVPDIGVHDDFFAIGGHSLLATKIIVRVNATFGVDLPLNVVFRHPTIAELGTAVETEVCAQVAALPEEEVRAELARTETKQDLGATTP